MAKQDCIQDSNQFPALIAHSGTAGTAETIRVVASSAGALSVDVVSGEIIASLGTVKVLEAGSVIVTAGTIVAGSVSSLPQAIIIDEPNGSTTYFGYAVVGASSTASVWQVKRCIDDGTTATFTYADGNGSYDNLWSGRATATYS